MRVLRGHPEIDVMTALLGIDLAGASTLAVHQDRLVLMGSALVPDLVLASRTGSHRDFRLATTDRIVADADATPPVEAQAPRPVTDPENPPGGADFTRTAADGFWLEQNSSRQNTFHAAIQQEGLFIFGDLGEASVPAGAFTSDTVVIRENSWHGTELGRTVLIVSGLVVFVQRGRADIRGINWSEESRKYLAPSLIANSGNLFDEAVDMSYAPSQDRRSDTVYVIGRSKNVAIDGQLAVMLLRHQAPFNAWSTWRTRGRILGGAAPLGNRVFLVERGGNPIKGIPGRISLETIAPQGTDSLDGEHSAPCQRDFVARGNIEGDTVLSYGPLPESARWLTGLTDLDGLEAWHIDDEGKTFVVTDRDEVIARNPALAGTPASIPVLRVGEDHRIYERTDPTKPLWRELAPAWQDDRDATKLRLVAGLSYTRSVETLPFVARKATGSQSRLRPNRIMDVVIDYALEPGQVLPRGNEIDRESAILSLTDTVVSIIPSKRERARSLRVPRAAQLDASRIVRCRYGGRAGWRDRLAIRIEASRHVTIAGLAYRALA